MLGERLVLATTERLGALKMTRDGLRREEVLITESGCFRPRFLGRGEGSAKDTRLPLGRAWGEIKPQEDEGDSGGCSLSDAGFLSNPPCTSDC